MLQHRCLTPLPAAVPARRGILAANMETALNGLWDSAAGPADRIVVVGAGVIGLTGCLPTARLPGAEVTMVDVDSSRKSVASHLNVRFASPAEAPGEAPTSYSTPAAIRPALPRSVLCRVGGQRRGNELVRRRRRRWPRSAARSTAAGSSSSRRRWGTWRPRAGRAGPMRGAWLRRLICWLMTSWMP